MPCIETLLHDLRVRYKLKLILRKKISREDIKFLIEQPDAAIELHLKRAKWTLTIKGRAPDEIFVMCRENSGRYAEALRIKVREIF